MARALQAAAELHNDRRAGQANLFEASSNGEEAARPTESLPDLAEWPDTEKLKFEKEALDFYLSSHPLAQHSEILRRFALYSVEELHSLPANTEVTMGGMLTHVRFMNTKKE